MLDENLFEKKWMNEALLSDEISFGHLSEMKISNFRLPFENNEWMTLFQATKLALATSMG